MPWSRLNLSGGSSLHRKEFMRGGIRCKAEILSDGPSAVTWRAKAWNWVKDPHGASYFSPGLWSVEGKRLYESVTSAKADAEKWCQRKIGKK